MYNVIGQIAIRLIYTTEVVKVTALTEGKRLIRIIPVNGRLAHKVDKAVGNAHLGCDPAGMLFRCLGESGRSVWAKMKHIPSSPLW
jgi:hypothetical protein